MMRIPSSFWLLGQRHTVEYADDAYIQLRAGGDPCYGIFIPDEQRILLMRPRETLSEQQVQQTFFHELFHALFRAAGYPELGDDEDLVDMLGSLLLQFMVTFEFERPVPSSG